jgi:hypothetical protein
MSIQASFQNKKIIFVGGPPRSGTSLVQRVLDSHPLIYGGPEFDRIPDIIKLKNKLYHSIDSKRIHLFVNKDDVNRCITNLIENLLFPAMERAHKRFISEKTPANILVFHELVQIFPDAKYIFVVRDPRAIIASLKKVRNNFIKKHHKAPDNFAKSIMQSIRYTKKCLNAGFDFIQQNPEKGFVIQYEQLVEDPIEVTKDLCSFVGVSWNDGMLKPNDVSMANKEGVGIDDIWASKESYFRNIQAGENEKWKEELTNIEKAIVTTAFNGDYRLLAMGYNITADVPSLYKKMGYAIYACKHISWQYIERLFETKLAHKMIRYIRSIKR